MNNILFLQNNKNKNNSNQIANTLTEIHKLFNRER